MQGIKFEKVSFEQFEKDFNATYGQNRNYDRSFIASVYEAIKLPKRSTSGSAGYDFYMPKEVVVSPYANILIPTGIRCKMPSDVMLSIFPRSGLGFKYRMKLDNTVGIIDSDYYNADNEGHIMIKFTNGNDYSEHLNIKTGERFAQGIFTTFLTTEDDNADGKRKGGMGSTGK